MTEHNLQAVAFPKLHEEIERDGKDFVRTGAALAQSPYWTARRQPFLLETNHPGVFAAGDVLKES